MHYRTITEIVINKKITAPKKVRQMITAMGDHKVIATKGGYIFNVSFQESTITLGILPYFIHGQRTRHYDIEMPEDYYKLFGFINSNGSMDLMFKVSKADYKAGLSDATKQQFAANCIDFAAFLLEYGFPQDCLINQVTVALMAEIGIIIAPPTVSSLANSHTCSEHMT